MVITEFELRQSWFSVHVFEEKDDLNICVHSLFYIDIADSVL